MMTLTTQSTRIAVLALLAGLSGNVPVQAETKATAIDLCHQLAASDLDTGLPAPFQGVPFDRIDTEAAIPACRQAVAEQPDNPRLVYQLARALDQANRDLPEAADLYARAGRLGSPLALNNLAAFYAEGRGVPQDKSHAVALFQQAAQTGLPMALTNLGFHHWDGEGVAQDRTQAVALFRQAAKAGDAQAMYWLAHALETGQGTATDTSAALDWYKAAALAGDLDSALDAARLHLREDAEHSPDFEAAAIQYRLAANGGHPGAAAWLAKDILAGKVAPLDPDELLRLLRLAASTGEVQALLNLWQAQHKAERYSAALVTAYDAYDRALAASLNEGNGWPVYALTTARSVQRSLQASELPPRSADELRMFQADFPISSLRQFSLTFDCGADQTSYDLYLWDWTREHDMVTSQLDWIETAKGCVVPPDIRAAFTDVWTLAKATGASYPDLAGQEIDDDGRRYAAP
ncbi:DUF2610 domain-containing protein [Mameliella alba]|nr:DUF2610 domain-containing protein [Mameliella alba]MBY6175392.1 DUF2610 domain-containing protein [Mameliella alba]